MRRRDYESGPLIARNEFLRLALGLGAALFLGDDSIGKMSKVPTMAKRTLGKTGLGLSVIGFGGNLLHVSGPEPLLEGLNLGINWVDTSPIYGQGRSETILGDVLRRHGKKIVFTKWLTTGFAAPGNLLSSLDWSLARIGRDHVDAIMIHGAANIAQVNCPGTHEAFAWAKKQGKARFLGLSVHTNQETVINAAIANGSFDFLMVRFNFFSPPSTHQILEEARKRGMGIIAMKVAEPYTFSRGQIPADTQKSLIASSIRWALSKPFIHSVVLGMGTVEDVKNNVTAQRRRFDSPDLNLLKSYSARSRYWNEYCRSCGSCSAACPKGIDIAEIIRLWKHQVYLQDPEDLKSAYRAIGFERSAARCDACGLCERECPYGLRVIESLADAHRTLSG